MNVGQICGEAFVIGATPETSVRQAARKMSEEQVGALMVVGHDGRVVGVVTDRDLCMASFTRNETLSRMPVRDAMSKEAFTCGEDDDETRVHTLMREHQVRRLPVIDGEGHLRGIVSLNDLALAKGATDRRQREVVRTLVEVSRHREVAAAV